MGIEAGAKSGFGALKSHWVFFLIFTAVVVGLAIKYDRTNNGAISSRLAGLPLVGRFFA